MEPKTSLLKLARGTEQAGGSVLSVPQVLRRPEEQQAGSRRQEAQDCLTDSLLAAPPHSRSSVTVITGWVSSGQHGDVSYENLGFPWKGTVGMPAHLCASMSLRGEKLSQI